jgi:serine/threonine-protein kinase RsbW
MAYPLELEQKLITDLKNIPPFINKIAQEILLLTGEEEESFHVKLALEEALTNAMRHGNKLHAGTQVSVKIQADRKGILMDIHDEGPGFDFHSLSDPTAQENLHRPSGRGVFLMRKLMDKVEFYDGGSGVRLSKTFLANP